jgi:hypothetical protein|tara:strand:+ start:8652 stop:8897 length:246 start_codon:yes stop_codon:yes gene_type:complete
MDGRKNNGGHSTKGFAGRKPKDEEIKLVERLSPLEDDALRALSDGVKSGDIKWITLYLNYYLGKPRETRDINVNEDLPLFL